MASDTGEQAGKVADSTGSVETESETNLAADIQAIAGDDAEHAASIKNKESTQLYTKKDRDIAEQKRLKDVALKRSLGQTPKFLETMGTEMIDLYVGPEEKLFRIHRGILCDKVPYFQKMFSSGFIEGQEGQAFFPEDDPEAFDLLNGWVYFGTLRPFKFTLHPPPASPSCNWDMVQLYCLADKFCLPELMDRIVDANSAECRSSNISPSFRHVKKAYMKTPMGSTLRKYMCYSMVHIFTALREESTFGIWDTQAFVEMMNTHGDFAIDFLSLLRSQSVGVAPTDPRKLPKCHFHCHGANEPCPQKPEDKPEDG